jgi:POT family proton-dependent oligopeptide transporter
MSTTTYDPNLAAAAPSGEADKGWFGHPRGLSTLFFTELWERFSYYGMRALLVLYMVASPEAGGLGYSVAEAAKIYGIYTALVYLTAMPGGWIADRYLGQYKSVLIGGIIIAFGHFSMAFTTPKMFFAGMALIVIGTGLLKPNISAMVGSLYSPGDQRRDGGFSIFYMGINMGAFFAPLVCGYLGQNEKFGWHYGFAAAGVGMILGLIQYVAGKKKLKPAIDSLERRAKEEKRKSDEAKATFTKEEWKRLAALFVLFMFASLFWAGFEQAGSSLNIFADRHTANTIFGWDFPSSWFQSLNPMYILLLAPVFSILWVRMGKYEPSGAAKFATALLLVGLGFLLLVPAALLVSETTKVSPMWLVGLYFLHTFGELMLSPVGLSLCTKLSPARITGLVMGFWFTSSSLGNYIGGYAASMFEKMPLDRLFFYNFLTVAIAAGILYAFVPTLKRMTGSEKV